MTDNEILARWQGFNPDVNDVEGYYLPKGYVEDYPNDAAACDSLLDTLVEKGYTFTLYPEMDNNKLFGCCIWEHERSRWSSPVAESENKPTRREAIIAACLDVARKERGNENFSVVQGL